MWLDCSVDCTSGGVGGAGSVGLFMYCRTFC